MYKLTQIKAKNQVSLVEIAAGHGLKRHLESIGFVPGVSIQVIQNSRTGPMRLKLRGSQIALGRNMANRIWVMTPEEKKADEALFGEESDLRRTKQREKILGIITKLDGHLTTEEIIEAVRKKDKTIGATTVYRTLKALVSAGFLREQIFSDGITRFESAGSHHDHMICIGCGEIVEFVDEQIESLQKKAAKKKGFEVIRHRLELYGYCSKCKRG